MKPPPFAYVGPRSLEATVAALAEHGEDAKVIAGGQSLGPLLNMRLASPEVVVDINRLGELTGLHASGAGLKVEALVRQNEVERSDAVAAGWPLITEAMPHIGHVGTRNRGTFVGSAAHADPAAEIPAILTALGAELELVSARGARRVPAESFYISFLTTAIADDELVTSVHVPSRGPRSGSSWTEFTLRHGDYALVGVAATMTLAPDDTIADARVAYAGVADTPLVVEPIVQLLIGKRGSRELFAEAGELAAAELRPSSDVLASADYKRHLTRVLTRRALERAETRAGRRTNGA